MRAEVEVFRAEYDLYSMLISLAERLPRGGKILDLGGRDIRFARRFARIGHRVVVVSPRRFVNTSSAAIDFRRDSIEAYVHRCETMPGVQHPYHLVIVNGILPFVDPTILTALPAWLERKGYVYIKTFAEDDPVCLLNQYVPVEFIEIALAPAVKIDERTYWSMESAAPPSAHRRHIIELLFQKP